jgi:hypothetical protein
MSEGSPRVSVLMPVYNGLPYLPAALESILEQSFTDFELIAVDDGSQDESGKVLDDYAGRDARIQVIHADHGGLVAALSRAHAASRGTYLARMDADDVSYPDRLQRQVDLLDAQPEVAVASCAADVLDEDGHRIGKRIPQFHDDMLLELAAGNPIVHGSVMMRRSDFEEAGGYEQPPEDYDLWIRLARRGKKFALARGEPSSPVLYGFRTHAQRYSLSRLRPQSGAILRVQLPLLDEVTQRYWGGEPAGEAHARDHPPPQPEAMAKLIEGWGRVAGSAWICDRPALAERSLHNVFGLFSSIRPTALSSHHRQVLRTAFHAAADAMVWSGAPRPVALRLRMRQLLLQPGNAARWRDAALAAVAKRRNREER